MCTNTNCPHELSERDKKIASAFYSTIIFTQMFANLREGKEALHDDIAETALCAHGCANDECGRRNNLHDAMAIAIDHVDNGTPLPFGCAIDELVLEEAEMVEKESPSPVFASRGPVKVARADAGAIAIDDEGVPTYLN